MKNFQLRAAEPRDLPAICGLIAELAEFEHLSHLVQGTPESLRPHLFGEKPVAEAVVATLALVAYAVAGAGRIVEKSGRPPEASRIALRSSKRRTP